MFGSPIVGSFRWCEGGEGSEFMDLVGLRRSLQSWGCGPGLLGFGVGFRVWQFGPWVLNPKPRNPINV